MEFAKHILGEDCPSSEQDSHPVILYLSPSPHETDQELLVINNVDEDDCHNDPES